jgi:hypothetical protein
MPGGTKRDAKLRLSAALLSGDSVEVTTCRRNDSVWYLKRAILSRLSTANLLPPHHDQSTGNIDLVNANGETMDEQLDLGHHGLRNSTVVLVVFRDPVGLSCESDPEMPALAPSESDPEMPSDSD